MDQKGSSYSPILTIRILRPQLLSLEGPERPGLESDRAISVLPASTIGKVVLMQPHQPSSSLTRFYDLSRSLTSYIEGVYRVTPYLLPRRFESNPAPSTSASKTLEAELISLKRRYLSTIGRYDQGAPHPLLRFSKSQRALSVEQVTRTRWRLDRVAPMLRLPPLGDLE